MESTPPQSSAALSGSEKGRTPPLAPFRSRNFTLLWLGSFVSEAGSQMQVVAVSWQVYQLTHDPLALGGIGVARIVPLVLLALGSGVLADALDRRKLMLFSQLAMMLCSASLALANSLGAVSIWWIYALTTFSSAARTLGMPARQAVIPSLVPREQLPSALSLNIISWQAATIMGPTLGGLIIAGWSVSVVYWIDAISFLAVIAALLVMRLAPIAGERRQIFSQGLLDCLKRRQVERGIHPAHLAERIALQIGKRHLVQMAGGDQGALLKIYIVHFAPLVQRPLGPVEAPWILQASPRYRDASQVHRRLDHGVRVAMDVDELRSWKHLQK